MTHSNYISFFLKFCFFYQIMDCHHKCSLTAVHTVLNKVIELCKPVQHRAGTLWDWATEGDATKTALFRSCVYRQTCFVIHVLSLWNLQTKCVYCQLWLNRKLALALYFRDFPCFRQTNMTKLANIGVSQGRRHTQPVWHRYNLLDNLHYCSLQDRPFTKGLLSVVFPVSAPIFWVQRESLPERWR